MPTIAISGAGSGIGHSFLEHFAADPSNTIHAIDRSFSDAVSISDSTAELIRHTLDVSSPESIADLRKALDDKPIDLFIHSAAIRGLVPSVLEKQDEPGPAETLEAMDAETMMKTLQINTVGSFLLIKALLPNLKAAKKGGKVVIMGSRMGSIESNKDGSAYAYRASKAGVNALIKSFSIDVPEVCFTIIHPGRVESRMVPNMREDRAIDAEDAIKMMLPMIEKFSKDNTGNFYDRDGEEIPW